MWYYFVSASIQSNGFFTTEYPPYTNLLIKSDIPLTLRDLEKEIEKNMEGVYATILYVQFLTEQQYLELK